MVERFERKACQATTLTTPEGLKAIVTGSVEQKRASIRLSRSRRVPISSAPVRNIVVARQVSSDQWCWIMRDLTDKHGRSFEEISICAEDDDAAHELSSVADAGGAWLSLSWFSHIEGSKARGLIWTMWLPKFAGFVHDTHEGRLSGVSLDIGILIG